MLCAGFAQSRAESANVSVDAYEDFKRGGTPQPALPQSAAAAASTQQPSLPNVVMPTSPSSLPVPRHASGSGTLTVPSLAPALLVSPSNAGAVSAGPSPSAGSGMSPAARFATRHSLTLHTPRRPQTPPRGDKESSSPHSPEKQPFEPASGGDRESRESPTRPASIGGNPGRLSRHVSTSVLARNNSSDKKQLHAQQQQSAQQAAAAGTDSSPDTPDVRTLQHQTSLSAPTTEGTPSPGTGANHESQPLPPHQPLTQLLGSFRGQVLNDNLPSPPTLNVGALLQSRPDL